MTQHTNDFLPSGSFTVGANYWASHAGTNMWRDWRPEVVADDFARLAGAGLQLLRVFPLWPDFQPIENLRSGHGQLREIRHGDEPLAPAPDGAMDGVAPVMIERLRTLADLAGQNGLSLIVALITGWMSGRFYVPPALDGLNAITDPASIMWQVKMVKRIVKELRDHPAISAWGLGNECNVMGSATREQAWTWTALIANTIRVADPARPVISDLHGLSTDPNRQWSIRDQAELTDLLTTHPYPIFTPHCDQDRIDSMRPILHAAAETRLYADIGGRPAFAEEMGTLGPMWCGDATSADFARASLYSLWAHDCRASLWWCACDQAHLTHPPYDWVGMETELGLLRSDGAPRPVLREIGALSRTIAGLPFAALPPRTIEAVCLLTHGQDSWGVGQTAFLLAKQAGFDLTFSVAEPALPQAELYLLPSLKGQTPISRRAALALMDRVRDGAALYISLDGVTILARFEELAGLEVSTRRMRTSPLSASFDGVASELTWQSPSASTHQILMNATRAEVLGRESDGVPIFTRADYGKGRVYVLAFPLEAEMSGMPGVFQEGPPIWRLYEHMAKDLSARRILRKSSPSVGITEHPVSERERIAVLINYDRNPISEQITIAPGWSVVQVCRGAEPVAGGQSAKVDLPGLDAAIWRLSAG